MLDWEKIVRDKLGSLPMDASKADEIVEELAHQLEAAYQEELARGISHAEAARRSLVQFQDWEKLRREIFQSASGARLPVWQQKGLLSPRRPVVWIALAVSLVFLALPSFRKALHILPFADWPDAWSASAFSSKALRHLEKSGDTQKYARALAYVALHSPDEQQSAQAADRAIALDPHLTWICAKMTRANFPPPDYDSARWLKRLEAWDPDNAYVYLLAAGVAQTSEPKAFTYAPSTANLRRALFADSRWRASMEQAFSAKRWDDYEDKQFALERQVLWENGLDRPEKLLAASSALPLPLVGLLQMYADDVAEQEEKVGHPEQALGVYLQVASVAQQLAAGSTDIEHFAAAALAKDSHKQVTRVLQTLGRNVGSDPTALALASIPAFDRRGEFNRRLSSPACRAGRIVGFSSVAFLSLACLSALWLVCAVALRFNPDLSRVANSTVRWLSWAPLLLPVSCLAVFLNFLPYAKSLADYPSPHVLDESFGAFFIGAFSLRYSIDTNIWIHRMFWPAIWCAAVCAVGIRVLSWVRSRREPNHSATE